MSAPKAARERYAEYLQSQHWEQLRFLALEHSGNKCECCECEKGLHVHHIHYRDLTDCTVSDVMVLCWRCHSFAHEAFRLARRRPSDYSREETVKTIHVHLTRESITPKKLSGSIATAELDRGVKQAIAEYQNNKCSKYAVLQLIARLQVVLNST
jgi:hypothetical protein